MRDFPQQNDAKTKRERQQQPQPQSSSCFALTQQLQQLQSQPGPSAQRNWAERLENVLNDYDALQAFKKWMGADDDSSEQPLRLHFALLAYRERVAARDYARAPQLAASIFNKFLRPHAGLCNFIKAEAREKVGGRVAGFPKHDAPDGGGAFLPDANLFAPCEPDLYEFLRGQHQLFCKSGEFIDFYNASLDAADASKEAKANVRASPHCPPPHFDVLLPPANQRSALTPTNASVGASDSGIGTGVVTSARRSKKSDQSLSHQPLQPQCTNQIFAPKLTANSLYRSQRERESTLGQTQMEKMFNAAGGGSNRPVSRYPYVGGQATTSKNDSAVSSSFSSDANHSHHSSYEHGAAAAAAAQQNPYHHHQPQQQHRYPPQNRQPQQPQQQHNQQQFQRSLQRALREEQRRVNPAVHNPFQRSDVPTHPPAANATVIPQAYSHHTVEDRNAFAAILTEKLEKIAAAFTKEEMERAKRSLNEMSLNDEASASRKAAEDDDDDLEGAAAARNAYEDALVDDDVEAYYCGRMIAAPGAQDTSTLNSQQQTPPTVSIAAPPQPPPQLLQMADELAGAKLAAAAAARQQQPQQQQQTITMSRKARRRSQKSCSPERDESYAQNPQNLLQFAFCNHFEHPPAAQNFRTAGADVSAMPAAAAPSSQQQLLQQQQQQQQQLWMTQSYVNPHSYQFQMTQQQQQRGGAPLLQPMPMMGNVNTQKQHFRSCSPDNLTLAQPPLHHHQQQQLSQLLPNVMSQSCQAYSQTSAPTAFTVAPQQQQQHNISGGGGNFPQPTLQRRQQQQRKGFAPPPGKTALQCNEIYCDNDGDTSGIGSMTYISDTSALLNNTTSGGGGGGGNAAHGAGGGGGGGGNAAHGAGGGVGGTNSSQSSRFKKAIFKKARELSSMSAVGGGAGGAHFQTSESAAGGGGDRRSAGGTTVVPPGETSQKITISYKSRPKRGADADGGASSASVPVVAHVPMKQGLTFKEFRRYLSIPTREKKRFFFRAACEDGSAPYQLLMVNDDPVILPVFEGKISAECVSLSDSE